tara:strand:+ start:434 stop:814 length:381 start_codon:yes stop_codon:yes gene_type:complete
MAYYPTINLVQGDTRPQIKFTLKDSNQAVSGQTLDPDDSDTFDPIDLSTANTAVQVKIRKIGETALLATETCTITDATGGKVSMNWSANTLATAEGSYEGEIIVNFGGTAPQTVYDKLKFNVRADF